ncbi:LacI family DNA-binding transcriptional regulator [Mangrovimonas spongiae]|uniref:LacI family transcriptional regulator n=1 Tax=Mangrovimonas spongiae TaxID=2494697 RepID=A0A3R9MGE9_9FLAO|nr:LacI family DNA-binding transcriptional regulator [Mangrovimonas spongiae]RSK39865.1 LacI family transcriptional regulator [Mangrovimonas spongiae]
MPSKTTLKDLANLAGVSVSTVSKALNDSPEIGARTRQRIKDIAESCNYVPNNIARSLKSRSTKTIGVIIPAILIEFFNKVLYGIEQEATERGYKIVICLSNESSRKEAESINTFINGSVDGVILSVAEETQKSKVYDHFEKSAKHNMPMVMFDRVLDDITCDKVTVDDFEGAFNAVKFLSDLGSKNILFLNPISNTSVGQHREDGYVKAVSGLNQEPNIVNVSHYTEIEKALSTVFNNQKIDAILAADEYSAALAQNAARLNNLKIPQDLSVIGFTNGMVAEYANPSLTVVSQHAENIGKIAAGILLDRIEGKLRAEPVNKVVKTKIVERNSTKNI